MRKKLCRVSRSKTLGKAPRTHALKSHTRGRPLLIAPAHTRALSLPLLPLTSSRRRPAPVPPLLSSRRWPAPAPPLLAPGRLGSAPDPPPLSSRRRRPGSAASLLRVADGASASSACSPMMAARRYDTDLASERRRWQVGTQSMFPLLRFMAYCAPKSNPRSSFLA